MSYEIEKQESYTLNAEHSLPLLPNGQSVSFTSGKKITIPIPKPLKVDIETLKRKINPGHFLAGPGIVVVSRDFVEGLKYAGVDNFQVFPAVLRHQKTNQTWRNYLAFNEIGLVDAALLELCRYTVISERPHRKYPLLDFTRLVFSLQKLKKNPKMFRMVHAPDKLYISGEIISNVFNMGISFKKTAVINEDYADLINLRLQDALDAVTLFLDFWKRSDPYHYKEYFIKVKKHLEAMESFEAYKTYKSIAWAGMGGFLDSTGYDYTYSGKVDDIEYWMLEDMVKKTLENLNNNLPFWIPSGIQTLDEEPLLKPTAETVHKAAQYKYKHWPEERKKNH
jgi:hypothetical protein